ncbi:MAG TPA: FAD-binding oxidoreductase [Casimicrobiaceae bacterium]|nr:FAD-binding oxidoreductase [Casimicrobiaceae bacterium]
MPAAAYVERRNALVASLRKRPPGPIRLRKETSNLFRDRARHDGSALDARAFDHVLGVDTRAGVVDAEGLTTYEALVAATLPHGVMPAVVPELKTITLGGAAAGVGIEASSFRYGLVHETLEEIDVLTGTGEIVTCRRDNAHADLFYGFPNSYGTLGYALRLRARTVPTRRYVAITHRRFDAAEPFFEALAQACAGDADFVDGVAFAPDELYLNEARFVALAPYTSDYTYRRIFYRSIRQREQDYLTVEDFIWRWDTDWFWCSKNLGAQHPLLRPLFGRARLGSRTYQKIMRWNTRWNVTGRLDRLRHGHVESVIQDVDLPLDAAAAFLAFFQREVPIAPVWICPLRAGPDASRFPLYPMKPDALYVNFGFWDVVRTREAREPGHFNRRVEAEVARLHGIKSLYSESYYSREAFDDTYGGVAYRALKARYDPDGAFPALYEKCVLKR